MSRPDGPALVIGVGNILLRDEGVGVRVARELEALVRSGQIQVPPGSMIVDGGTLGLDLLPMIEDSRALVLIDAVDLGRQPGAVAVMRGPALHGTLARHASPHEVGVRDLLALARFAGSLPDAVALVGIQPGEVAVGLELTEPVEAALPFAIEAVVAELRELAGTARVTPGIGPLRPR